jgi:uncharacterized protein (DUF952 family)/GNAT superfamily N-acetyltransferase
MGALILHIATVSDWRAAQVSGAYRTASLQSEGFIHCSTPDQVLRTANEFFRGQANLLLLLVDPGRASAELKYEPAAHVGQDGTENAELFPHLHGALELSAVRLAVPFVPGSDGRFSLPRALLEYAPRDIERVTFRTAHSSDVDAIALLIGESSRTLGGADYSAAQIEAALQTAWGVDSQLIQDQTYYVGEYGHELVACGGWSYRETLFGGDAQADRQAQELDPTVESARIRAFFVHPVWSRQGLGRKLLELCEGAALTRGFRSTQLVATLPGERLYSAFGYQSQGPSEYPLNAGQSITFVPMRKLLPAPPPPKEPIGNGRE